MRRQEVSFPLAFRLFLPAYLHRAIRAVFGPVGVGRKRRPADGAAFDLVPAFGDLGAQGRVQRQDGHLEPQYSEAKQKLKEYGIVKQNVDSILRTAPGKEHTQER